MSSDYSHKLSLWCKHDAADLSIILHTLNIAPKRIRKAGEARKTPKGTPLAGVYKNSCCTIVFQPLLDLPQSLSAAVDILKQHRAFLISQHESGVKFSFFVGWFSDGNSRDVLDWELLAEIAELRISLDIDFYGASIPSEEEQ